MDMHCGADRLLACVVQIICAALAHRGCLFANARATRNELLVHDGFGVWCAALRLNVGLLAQHAAQDTGRNPRSHQCGASADQAAST